MSYTIKEIFWSIHGEGANAGRPAVFVRFARCNLWSGREEDRASAICRFCDTQFRGGDVYDDATSLVAAAEFVIGVDENRYQRLVVLTGGEPALQVDPALLRAFKTRCFEVAIETNGTVALPPGIDYVTVSPKAGAELIVTAGDELKLVYPQLEAEPNRFARLPFARHYLQPMDGPDIERNRRAAARYCLRHPQWRLSLQIHKVVGLR